MSSVSSFSTHADSDLTLSECIDAFDWPDGVDQTMNDEDLQLLAAEDHVYTLDESNLRSSLLHDTNAAMAPSVQVAFSEPKNELGQGYEEYQRQVDLEILYQNAMMAHLQSKQFSQRSQAMLGGISSISMECQSVDQEQQEQLWNIERMATFTKHDDEPQTMRGTSSPMHDSTPTFGRLLTHKAETQTSYHNKEANRIRQEMNQQIQETYELSPRSSQGSKRSSLPCTTTVHKRRFALSFIDRTSTSQSAVANTRRSKSKSAGSETMSKDACNTINDLQRNRKKRNNTYPERKGGSTTITLGQDPPIIIQEKPKATCDQEDLMDSHTPLLAEELNQLDEHIQENYEDSEREILQLFLEEDPNVDDNSSQQTQMDILEQQFKRAIIAHQESKQKSKQTFLLTHSTSLHQESLLIKYTKDRSQFQNSIQSMPPIEERKEFSKSHTYVNDLDATSLQHSNTAGSLLNTNRLGLSQELDPSDQACLNIERGRNEEHQQYYDHQIEQRYRTNTTFSQNSTELCQQPMLDQHLNVIGSSTLTSINLDHEPKSPIGQQVTLPKRKVTLESIRAVEDLVSGRRSSLTKELEESRRRLHDFISQRK